MTPEEQEQRKKRLDELDLNSIEDREEAKRIFNEMERGLDADMAALPPEELTEDVREIWSTIKEAKAALVAITDALPIIPETVTRELFVPDLEELWLRQEVDDARNRMRPYRDRGERPPDDLHESYLDACDRYTAYMSAPSRDFDVPDSVQITEGVQEAPRIDPEEARLQEEYFAEMHRLAEYYERASRIENVHERLPLAADEHQELHKRFTDAADRLNEYKRKKRGL